MELLLLLLIFIPLFLMALREKKWFLSIFFAFYAILPDSFAIEMADWLPLLTASRILLIIVLIIYLRGAGFRILCRKRDYFLSFMIINVVIAFINLHYGIGEVNHIYVLTIEQFLLVVIIGNLIKGRADFIKCLDYIIYGGVGLSIIGIIQTTLQINPASVLRIVTDRSGGELAERMGITRAFGTSNAISFGAYCTVLILIILYMYENSKRKKYIIELLFVATALLFTLSRSAILSLAMVLIIMMILRNREMIRKYIKFFPLLLIMVLVVSLTATNVFEGITESIKSILNILGADFRLSERFGINSNNAVNSRMVQWTSVLYMIREGHGLLGYGYNAFFRGRMWYYYSRYGVWTPATTMDVGWVKYAVESGLVGLCAYGIFIFRIIREAVHRKSKRGFDFYNLSIYVMLLYVILNISAGFIDTRLIWLYFSLFFWYSSHWKEFEAEKGGGNENNK